MQSGVIVDWFKTVNIEFGRDFSSDSSYWVSDDDLGEAFEDLTENQMFDKGTEIFNKR